MEPTTYPAEWYLTSGGVVALTIYLVNLLKPVVANVRILRELPVFAYVVIVSQVLTWIAHSVMGTLPGAYPDLFLQALTLAVTSAGAREVLLARLTPVGTTHARLSTPHTKGRKRR
jgi:hypothetical protein